MIATCVIRRRRSEGEGSDDGAQFFMMMMTIRSIPDKHSHDSISQMLFMPPLMKLITIMVFHIFFSFMLMTASSDVVTLFFIASCSLNFIEMEANGRESEGERSILWAPV